MARQDNLKMAFPSDKTAADKDQLTAKIRGLAADPEQMGNEEIARLLFDDLKKDATPIQKATGPRYFYQEGETTFRPMMELAVDGHTLKPRRVEFEIPGLGRGAVDVYQVAEPKYPGLACFMSHGLEPFSDSLPHYRVTSQEGLTRIAFATPVGANESMVRPEGAEGYQRCIEEFMAELKNGAAPTYISDGLPALVVGSHEPAVDFSGVNSRHAIGGIPPLAKLMIFSDFVPYRQPDPQYQTPELQGQDWSYVPFNKLAEAVAPEFTGQGAVLMFTCRTGLAQRAAGIPAYQQGNLHPQPFPSA